MKSQKKPVVILDIDQTLFNTKVFKERLKNTNMLGESEYIELLYLIEKKFFQELVIKRDIPVQIFSSRKELLTKAHTFNDTEITKRLKDYLEDYKEFQIFLVDDNPSLLQQVKGFNKEIITIWLNSNRKETSKDIQVDKIIQKLEEIFSIVVCK